MRRATAAALMAWAAAAGVADPAGAQTMGYRGDGSSVFPGARPPTSFDEASGRNVLWKTPLPNWGHCQPVATAARVWLTTEPDPEHDFPVLRRTVA